MSYCARYAFILQAGFFVFTLCNAGTEVATSDVVLTVRDDSGSGGLSKQQKIEIGVAFAVAVPAVIAGFIAVWRFLRRRGK